MMIDRNLGGFKMKVICLRIISLTMSFFFKTQHIGCFLKDKKWMVDPWHLSHALQ